MINSIVSFFKRPSIRFTLINAFASALNYITIIILGRIFSVHDYGVINTMSAFVTNAGVVMIPLQIMICRLIANGNSKANDVDSDENDIKLMMHIFNLIECVVFLIGIKVFIKYLDLGNYSAYFVVIAALVVNNLTFIANGVAQGKQKFDLLGGKVLLMYAVKALIAIVLGLRGFGPEMTMFGMAIGEIIGAFWVKKSCRFSFAIHSYKNKSDQRKKNWVTYGWMLLLYIAISVYINNGDLLIGRLYMDSESVGLYSVAMNLAKISVFLVATPVATILLPKVAACTENKKRQLRLLKRAECVAIGCSVLYGLILYLSGSWLIDQLYGVQYKMATVYLAPTILFATILSGFYVFYQYMIVSDGLKFFTISTIICTIVAIIIMIMYTVNFQGIVVILSVAMTLSFALSIMNINCRKEKVNNE